MYKHNINTHIARWHKFLTVFSALLILFSPPMSAFALSESDLDTFAQNNILFYEPNASPDFCVTGGDCYIAGDTLDLKLWSGLRHVGFTPEQTAGLMGNISRESHSVTRQEEAYNLARDRNCTSKEGRPYDIYSDGYSGYDMHHDSCITGGYSAGGIVSGIGLGFVQWTFPNRRLGFLAKLEELGLLKYFEGDAYKTYGRYSDDEVREAIIKETGSDKEYWALWCATVKYIWTEMNEKYSPFFNNSSVADYAGWAAEVYENCGGCRKGQDSYNKRVAAAEKYYERYQNGEFDDVENGTLPSATGESSQSSGKNVTIIGDSITNDSLSALNSSLPDADIHAKDSKHFATDSTNNPSGVSILTELKNNDSIGNTIVFALGTNDTVSKDNIKSVIDITGPTRKIFFLTNYDIVNTTKYDHNNNEFTAAAATYDNVKIIDWKNAIIAATGSPSDYIIDETSSSSRAVRPTTKGTELFAKIISEAINDIKPSDTCAAGIDGDYEIYYQEDEPWGSIQYGNCYDKNGNPVTIADAGCGPASLAMIITALTKQRITPDVIAAKAVAGGYRVCDSGSYGTITNIATQYGLKVENYGHPSIDQISQYLRQGIMFQVAGSGPSPLTNGGHFIAIRGITSSGKWLIFDSTTWHKAQGTNEREWDPSEIYPYIGGDWRGVSK